MKSPGIFESSLTSLPWQELQYLLDSCFPRPPRDVFPRVVSASHRSQRVWLAKNDNKIVGVVMLSPHSKGGHLENLAVSPSMRGSGIGHRLVCSLLDALRTEGPGIVTLTTRIPSFFSRHGFHPCGTLSDGSITMIIHL